MDIADQAQQMYECLELHLVQNARERRNKVLPYVGHCHYCYEETESPKRFCDDNCMEDWEKEKRIQRINGVG